MNEVSLFGELPSVPTILTHEFISAPILKRLLNRGCNITGYHDFVLELKHFEKFKHRDELLKLCQKLGDAIVESGEVSLRWRVCADAADEKHAARVTDRCERSILGINRRTLPAEQVATTHPDWDSRMQELAVVIGEKLGLTGERRTTLSVELEELKIFGPGGKMMRTKGRDRGVVAKLVVQLPSLHVGGNMVVYNDRDPTRQYRFDFWRRERNGSVYAVYSASAEYEVEEVKNGDKCESVPTTQAVNTFGGTNETFALLLANEYGEYSNFEGKGSDLLKDGDHDMLHALQKANAQVLPSNQLKLYLVKIMHASVLTRNFDGAVDNERSDSTESNHWTLESVSESIAWLSTGGDLLYESECSGNNREWTTEKLNFLNPGSILPRAMCSHLRRYGEFDEQTIEYCAYAIVG
ncbi:unnamed protein product [Phytophthora lilii]|uniref:Unnamed protein product n=1 Tax=Phytophthora lilii TaxID=2077276 RepID=A0A9W6TLM8_9STRA|nr:unnamed protein product [Phytophthora lilii]